MAVTKSFPKGYVQIAHQGGITLFGENRVQEAVEKYRGLNLDLHLVGHLQRNKARKAVETFSCVQSIDKLETAKSLQQHCSNMDKKMDILLEVNTSGEESKFGFRNTEDFRAGTDHGDGYNEDPGFDDHRALYRGYKKSPGSICRA
ncbi:Pyridoxal phosphate homeostasis protein [subsurface metagenome]